MNDSTSIEEHSPVPQPRIPGIHVTTRRAGSAIMFLEPVISVDPETHKQRNREVLGMTKSKSLAKVKTKAKAQAKDPVAQINPEDTGGPSTSTRGGGRKKKKVQSMEPVSEQPTVKNTPRPRARPLRTRRNAAPTTMVMDSGPPSDLKYVHVATLFLDLDSITRQQ
jgi:hypothetical protein